MRIYEEEIEHVVVGSGAAGFQAALRLRQNGQTSLAVVTENVRAGTSRNTGSDKQTYYKLSLAGADSDSVRAMAEDLFAGQCVDGDQALCEAALSSRCFFRLTELGVPFPCTEHGEYMGYKTDHDRGRRATSAGPYTSHMMTECLEREVRAQGIRILDQTQAVHILTVHGAVRGLLCLDKTETEEATYKLIWCRNLILATGGPAGMYHDSVYPQSQIGSSGIAFEAGAIGKNLTEWQFGMASVCPRWNVSGTYMQVLPRFVSTDRDGSDEREFLPGHFDSISQMLSLVFLKGYQWPFDVSKIFGGSSMIDLLVYQETVLNGRRVFLDFMHNPGGETIDFEQLCPEAHDYLAQAGACFGTPIERLRQMNEPAIAFYREHGVDLSCQKLEIAVCAQHNNGGLATDAWWQTNIQSLYAIGEVNGSHGVTRPGGTALNAGQVGALRAAKAIHLKNCGCASIPVDPAERETIREQAKNFAAKAQRANGAIALSTLWEEAAKRMSAVGGMIRNPSRVEAALTEVRRTFADYESIVCKPSVSQLALYYHLRDMLLSQEVYLSAMLDYCRSGAGSRGSALYTDTAGDLPAQGYPELFRCRLDAGAHGTVVQEVQFTGDGSRGRVESKWRAVRPIPEVDYFFETQWKLYRQRNNL